MKKCIEGSAAVAEVVRLIKPDVVAAYPITPQTHIVENLAKFKSDGKAGYDFIRSESEFAAASIVLGASAAGGRAYSATSSQGLLLMTEVVYTIAGMRLPVVMTVANRAISAPINIWNDTQDYMTVRDCGWIALFAETNQEAVDMHLVAFKVAEKTKIPVMVNMDGFVLTHTFEPVDVPDEKLIKRYLPKYLPEQGQYLNVMAPVSMGIFATPTDYLEIREELHDDIVVSEKILKKEFLEFKKIFGRGKSELVEYYGREDASIVFVTVGSLAGTIKEAIDDINTAGGKAALARLKCFRPFPGKELAQKLEKAKYVAVVDKNISLGSGGALAGEVKAALYGKSRAKVRSFVAGLGGRDITKQSIFSMYKKTVIDTDKPIFIH